MKTITTLLLPLLLAMVHAQDAPLPPAPPEIAAARARYQAATQAAMVPLRARYIEDLRSILTRAVQTKNVALVTATEAELKTLVPAGKEDDFETRLIGTSWTWLHPEFKLKFQPNGEATLNGAPGYKYKITNKARREVEGTFAGGQRVFKYTFDPKMQTAKGVLDGNQLFDSKPSP